MATSLLGT